MIPLLLLGGLLKALAVASAAAIGPYAGADAPSAYIDPDVLKAVRLPHTFSADEQRAIGAQLDKLRLGIDMFLAQDGSLGADEQQRAYNNVWPLVRRLFAADFAQRS